MGTIRYNDNNELLHVDSPGESYDTDLNKFAKEAKNMSKFQLLKNYGINGLIEKGIRIAYNMEYNSKIRSECAYKKYKVLRETLKDIGPKGSIQRYKALIKALDGYGLDLQNNTALDVLSCNEIVGLILESVVEEKLIDEAMKCQELLVEYSKDKKVIWEIKRYILSLICRMKNIVSYKEEDFERYLKKIELRYDNLSINS